MRFAIHSTECIEFEILLKHLNSFDRSFISTSINRLGNPEFWYTAKSSFAIFGRL
jgi:hypothetical protein